MSTPINSPSLELLFRQIGVAEILAFVTDQQREDLTLDFKLAPSNFSNRDDRKTLAEAVSGFANSSGGLIVWGVDARKDADGIDCAQQAIPLSNEKLFISRLVEHAGNATSPSVDGVQHRLVEGNDGPFALTLVPESDLGPHMAKLGEDRYYKRSGDRFYRMEHFDLADMRAQKVKDRGKFRQLAAQLAILLLTKRESGRFPARISFASTVARSALVLLVIVLSVESRPLSHNRLQPTTSFSIPVSPSVVSTIATKDERLVLLVLWRGAARWYSSGDHRSANSGFGQDGTIHVSLQYGDISADLLFDPTAHTAVVQGRTNRVPANANVLLVDGVGRGRSGQMLKAFFLDPRDANMDIRRGSLAPLLARSPEIVDFLQCDAFPDQIKSADPCAALKKQ